MMSRKMMFANLAVSFACVQCFECDGQKRSYSKNKTLLEIEFHVALRLIFAIGSLQSEPHNSIIFIVCMPISEIIMVPCGSTIIHTDIFIYTRISAA